jgi:curli biogenesis system outer membrane secretion channel CsgG
MEAFMHLGSSLRPVVFAALSAVISGSAFAESIQEKTDRAQADIPMCSHRIGSIAVYEPQNNWWQPLGLESPEALLKFFVMRSGCFSLVDRGKGFAAVQQERALASNGDLQQGSNMGKGQIKAADYVLVPDIVSKNSDAGGTNVGGILGGLVGHGAGAILGGLSVNSSTADVLLTVTDVRSSEQVAMEEGHGSKSDVSFGVGGGWGNWSGAGAIGISNYQHTQIGQVVVLAYIDAYTKLVGELGGLSTNAAQSSVQQAVSMTRMGHLYTTSSTKSAVIKTLAVGTMLYPTGNKDGVMWEVKDELGNDGWVSSNLFQLAK